MMSQFIIVIGLILYTEESLKQLLANCVEVLEAAKQKNKEA